ncbi:unnamed protein product, partial [Owenia fusiformis]
KVIEKYEKPDDCIPGVKGKKEPLPHVPLSGMINKSGGKVRLTFKLENDQLWIGTKGTVFWDWNIASLFPSPLSLIHTDEIYISEGGRAVFKTHCYLIASVL